jgi:hypothetical protein
MLQMVGASDYTIDTQYEEQKVKYQRLVKLMVSIQTELKKLQKMPGIVIDQLEEYWIFYRSG